MLNKSFKVRSKTRRTIIGWATGGLWLAVLLFQIITGVGHWALSALSFVTCVVFFWNLSQRTMEKARNFDEREKELIARTK